MALALALAFLLPAQTNAVFLSEAKDLLFCSHDSNFAFALAPEGRSPRPFRPIATCADEFIRRRDIALSEMV